ncbi:hypothetical protein G3I76_74025 [Streptomyces sp. SID11233]|nr:hypothetical protein [Streptomyces sp. SID11233]
MPHPVQREGAAAQHHGLDRRPGRWLSLDRLVRNLAVLDSPTSESRAAGARLLLFDESTVVHLNYRSDGTQINRELVQNPDIGTYLAWRDLALEGATAWTYGSVVRIQSLGIIGCPPGWVDDGRRILVQGRRADTEALSQAAPDSPRSEGETLIILEPRMIPLLKEAIRVAESD